MSSILSAAFKRSAARRRRRMAVQGASLLKSKKKKGKLWWSSSARLSPKVCREEERVKQFRRWCVQVGIQLHPQVSIQSTGVCDGLGVVAQGAIKQGECVALLPRTSLLTCENSHIRDLIKGNKKWLKNCSSSWVPLLLALGAEYSLKESSKWYPYLSLVPTKDTALPMLWVESVRECLLEGSGVNDWVRNDLQRLQHDYSSLVKPFASAHPELFKVSLASCEVYKKLVAFVMSYSFTDEGAGLLGRTMMVPFVDLLNHSSQHHVELTFHPSCLKLVAVRNISEGEEIMNTYGQHSNASLLHMYGFTEPGNPHDEAVITCEAVEKVYLQVYSDQKVWDKLAAQFLLEDEYTVSCKGQPCPELLTLTHLLCDRDKPKHKSSKPSVSLQTLSSKEKLFLEKLARYCLECYPEQLTAPSGPTSCFRDKQMHHTLAPPPFKTAPRERHSYQVVLGQQDSLRKLLSTLRH